MVSAGFLSRFSKTQTKDHVRRCYMTIVLSLPELALSHSSICHHVQLQACRLLLCSSPFAWLCSCVTLLFAGFALSGCSTNKLRIVKLSRKPPLPLPRTLCSSPPSHAGALLPRRWLVRRCRVSSLKFQVSCWLSGKRPDDGGRG